MNSNSGSSHCIPPTLLLTYFSPPPFLRILKCFLFSFLQSFLIFIVCTAGGIKEFQCLVGDYVWLWLEVSILLRLEASINDVCLVWRQLDVISYARFLTSNKVQTMLWSPNLGHFLFCFKIFTPFKKRRNMNRFSCMRVCALGQSMNHVDHTISIGDIFHLKE